VVEAELLPKPVAGDEDAPADADARDVTAAGGREGEPAARQG
jgi:hypothetical protein